MNTRHSIAAVLLFTLAAMSLETIGAPVRPGEGIVRDPVTGDYTATYWDEDETGGEFVTAELKTAAKVDPTVASSFKLSENWQIRYAYRLTNGAKAKQPLYSLRIAPISSLTSGVTKITPITEIDAQQEKVALNTPIGWWGHISANGEDGVLVSWLYSRTNYEAGLGIQPGSTQSGFGFSSHDLPGIDIVELQGNAGYFGFDTLGEGPDPYATDIARQMQEIEKNDFVPHNAAAPVVAVPEPFDAAVLLDSIRAHVSTWPGKQLLDSVFATQLDRYLAAAADAYRRNQPKAGKEHIKTLRKMLKKEHEDVDHDDDEEDGKHDAKAKHPPPIDRLAARILDFDLKYVLKRTGGDKDD